MTDFRVNDNLFVDFDSHNVDDKINEYLNILENKEQNREWIERKQLKIERFKCNKVYGN